MKILSTPIHNLLIIEGSTFQDKRGTFSRIFCEKELEPIVNGRKIVQVNHSNTRAVGTIRGLHFQSPPFCETKFVRCIKGKIWDVAVDLRSGSKTFLNWYAVELSPSNSYTLIIPEGFAHGFQTLEEESEILYLHTAFYNPETEQGLNYRDPCLNITWPFPVTKLSDRDKRHPFIDPCYQGMKL